MEVEEGAYDLSSTLNRRDVVEDAHSWRCGDQHMSELFVVLAQDAQAFYELLALVNPDN